MLTPESLTGEKTMVGSVLIIEADSLAAARAVVEADVYYTADVVSACAYHRWLR